MVVLKVPSGPVNTVIFSTPSNLMLVEALGAKPLPVTVIEVPTGPEVGPRNIPGITVNVEDAELVFESIAKIG